MLLGRAQRRLTRPQAKPAEPGEPPVHLRGEALERWYGRVFDTNPDTGTLDRSYSLWSLAVALLEVGCSARFVEKLLAERDVALGWDKFTDRRDADERYSTIVDKAATSQGSQRIHLNGQKVSEMSGSAVPTYIPGNAKTRNQQGFEFTVLSDLLAEPPEEVAYLVDGLLPTGGVSLWAAKPKVGKSVAVRNLALAVARGDLFLDRACHRGAVVLLALEEKRAEVANHFRLLGSTDELVHVHVGSAPATSKEGLAALANAISLYQPVLLIADPVLKLVRVRDSSDYAELTRELEPILNLARSSGCHIAATHHLGKMVREGGDDVLGSTALFGAVDTLVLMRRRKDNQRVVQTIQRYGIDLPEILVPMDVATGQITLGSELAVVQQVEARQAILDLFQRLKPGERLDQKAIREQAGVRTALAVRAVQELLAEGVIDRTGIGRSGRPFCYAIAGQALEEVEMSGSAFPSTSSPGNAEPENQTFLGEDGPREEELPW